MTANDRSSDSDNNTNILNNIFFVYTGRFLAEHSYRKKVGDFLIQNLQHTTISDKIYLNLLNIIKLCLKCAKSFLNAP